MRTIAGRYRRGGAHRRHVRGAALVAAEALGGGDPTRSRSTEPDPTRRRAGSRAPRRRLPVGCRGRPPGLRTRAGEASGTTRPAARYWSTLLVAAVAVLVFALALVTCWLLL